MRDNKCWRVIWDEAEMYKSDPMTYSDAETSMLACNAPYIEKFKGWFKRKVRNKSRPGTGLPIMPMRILTI